MASYVVGDIQGCLASLQALLASVHFDPTSDHLYAVGDLVNRGPQSLETLKFCHALGDRFRTVLGNHDLHLLAVARGCRAPNHKDTLAHILNSPDRETLLDWLQSQPLLLTIGDYTLVHAGIPPQWSLSEADERAREVEAVLADPKRYPLYFQQMYGNTPAAWRDDLEGVERWRCITNYFTRMRYCNSVGEVELTNKLPPTQGPKGYEPWYAVPGRQTAGDKILFGHWASLLGKAQHDNVIALDTGCVWGERLRMICLETGKLHHHPCNGTR